MAYKIAVATSDNQTVDLHFGIAKNFLIVEVCEQDGSFTELETRALGKELLTKAAEESQKSGGCCGANEKVLDAVGEILADCTYLLVAKIGNRPHRGLQQRGIHCLEAPYPIYEAVQKLNQYYVAHEKREQHVF